MNQYYIVEIQCNEAGEYSHLVHWAWDQDETKAQLKAESTFYTVLAAAAVSTLKSHAAILFSAEGTPLMNKCYYHEPEPEPDPEEPEVEENE